MGIWVWERVLPGLRLSVSKSYVRIIYRPQCWWELPRPRKVSAANEPGIHWDGGGGGGGAIRILFWKRACMQLTSDCEESGDKVASVWLQWDKTAVGLHAGRLWLCIRKKCPSSLGLTSKGMSWWCHEGPGSSIRRIKMACWEGTVCPSDPSQPSNSGFTWRLDRVPSPTTGL